MVGKQRETDRYMRRVRCHGLMRLTLAFCFSEVRRAGLSFQGSNFHSLQRSCLRGFLLGPGSSR